MPFDKDASHGRMVRRSGMSLRARFMMLTVAVLGSGCASLLGDYQSVDDTGPDSGVPPTDSGCSLGGHVACDPATNCGCTMTSTKCDVAPGCSVLTCVSTGPGLHGSLCDATGGTTGCWNDATCFAGICQIKACTNDVDCAIKAGGTVADWRCQPVGGCTRETFSACLNRCLLTDDAICYAITGVAGPGCLRVFPDVATCGLMGSHKKGESCALDADCQPGLFCDAKTNTCFQWCRTTPDCTSGGTCQSFSPAFSFDGVTYGYCG